MNEEELKCLFRITSANTNREDRFEGKVLLDTQKVILNLVIEKW